MSGYDSETALVSQSSLEQGETHVVVSVNSSLTRFILILDIWLTQVEYCTCIITGIAGKLLRGMVYISVGNKHFVEKIFAEC